jgi:hypothetical protein
MDDIGDLRKKLKKAHQECARLREEKEHLKIFFKSGHSVLKGHPSV